VASASDVPYAGAGVPQWGLTLEQRASKPWGIPEEWLMPGKVITDPIHGDIYLNRLEQAVIDSSPFARLRRVRQLATVHQVYPGATHTRFAHALGALRVVQDLLDIVFAQRYRGRVERDLFSEWDEAYRDHPERLNREYAQVTVLARLGALLHDFCHVAYGHTIEDDLGVLPPHDVSGTRYEAFYGLLGDGLDPEGYEAVQKIFAKPSLARALRPLVLSKEKTKNGKSLGEPAERLDSSYPFVADMVGNTICADLIDYLQRDHAYTGLPAAVGTRFMAAFYVVPGENAAIYPRRMALSITQDKRERKDVTSELLKYLRFRYELQERVIVHHAKLAADAMLGKLFELWRAAEVLRVAQSRGGAEFAALGDYERGDPVRVEEALAEDIGSRDAHDVATGEALVPIENTLRELGDDGLLETLAGVGGCDQDFPVFGDEIREVARDLLNRRLFKRAGQAEHAAAHQQLYELWGSAAARRELERQAARYAEIPEHHVSVWLPDPDMRLKQAEVLVDYDDGIAPFNEYSDRGEEIYRDHRNLWTITVFVHPSHAGKLAERAVLARLAELMGIAWDRHRPPGAKRPRDWRVALNADVVIGDQYDFDSLRQTLIEESVVEVYRGKDRTQSDDQAQVERAFRRIQRRDKTSNS
jgi:HD superfamily phosphohydrolase